MRRNSPRSEGPQGTPESGNARRKPRESREKNDSLRDFTEVIKKSDQERAQTRQQLDQITGQLNGGRRGQRVVRTPRASLNGLDQAPTPTRRGRRGVNRQKPRTTPEKQKTPNTVNDGSSGARFRGIDLRNVVTGNIGPRETSYTPSQAPSQDDDYVSMIKDRTDPVTGRKSFNQKQMEAHDRRVYEDNKEFDRLQKLEQQEAKDAERLGAQLLDTAVKALWNSFDKSIAEARGTRLEVGPGNQFRIIGSKERGGSTPTYKVVPSYNFEETDRKFASNRLDAFQLELQKQYAGDTVQLEPTQYRTATSLTKRLAKEMGLTLDESRDTSTEISTIGDEVIDDLKRQTDIQDRYVITRDKSGREIILSPVRYGAGDIVLTMDAKPNGEVSLKVRSSAFPAMTNNPENGLDLEFRSVAQAKQREPEIVAKFIQKLEIYKLIAKKEAPKTGGIQTTVLKTTPIMPSASDTPRTQPEKTQEEINSVDTKAMTNDIYNVLTTELLNSPSGQVQVNNGTIEIRPATPGLPILQFETQMTTIDKKNRNIELVQIGKGGAPRKMGMRIWSDKPSSQKQIAREFANLILKGGEYQQVPWSLEPYGLKTKNVVEKERTQTETNEAMATELESALRAQLALDTTNPKYRFLTRDKNTLIFTNLNAKDPQTAIYPVGIEAGTTYWNMVTNGRSDSTLINRKDPTAMLKLSKMIVKDATERTGLKTQAQEKAEQAQETLEVTAAKSLTDKLNANFSGGEKPFRAFGATIGISRQRGSVGEIVIQKSPIGKGMVVKIYTFEPNTTKRKDEYIVDEEEKFAKNPALTFEQRMALLGDQLMKKIAGEDPRTAPYSIAKTLKLKTNLEIENERLQMQMADDLLPGLKAGVPNSKVEKAQSSNVIDVSNGPLKANITVRFTPNATGGTWYFWAPDVGTKGRNLTDGVRVDAKDINTQKSRDAFAKVIVDKLSKVGFY